jgi:hypothetical protein
VHSSWRGPRPHCPELNASLADVIESVRAAGLEGVVAKRLDSRYEPGRRSGTWRKMRINQAQEFVIGGYTPGGIHFDALIFGCYEGGQLRYVGRSRSGFTRSSKEQLFRQFRGLEVAECPFANLPEGYRALKSLLFRDRRWTCPLALTARAQYLSSFGSYAQFVPSGNVRAGTSSIGSVKVTLIFCAGKIVV